MAFYDVGTGDLRELWESYLSEPVSDHRLLTNLFPLRENEKERVERNLLWKELHRQISLQERRPNRESPARVARVESARSRAGNSKGRLRPFEDRKDRPVRVRVSNSDGQPTARNAAIVLSAH